MRPTLEPEVFKRFDREVNWYAGLHSPVFYVPVSLLTAAVEFAQDGFGDLLLRLTLHPTGCLIGRKIGQSVIATVPSF